MRTVYARMLAVATIVLVTIAAAGATQSGSGTESDLLSASEVRQLVASAATAADHAKLSRHYAALAARYERDAAEHKALAAEYAKRPTPSETKRPGTPDTASHCERFAKLAADAAKEARALATAHEHMSPKQ